MFGSSNSFERGVSTGGSLISNPTPVSYTHLDVYKRQDKLRSRMNVICNYSDVKVNSISPNTNINVKGNYSDVVLSVPDNVGASFNVVLVQGDLAVAKKYTVKYTEQTETSTTVIKKGQIGNKRATATITVSSNYADVKIK